MPGHVTKETEIESQEEHIAVKALQDITVEEGATYDFMRVKIRSQLWLGRCVGFEGSAAAPTVLVREEGPDGAIRQADCLDQVFVAFGDWVLMAQLEGADRPVVMVAMGVVPRPARRLANGYTVACDATRVQLRGPDGRPALEIDTAGAAPTVRPVAGDLGLDLEGRLTIAAGWIS